MRIDEEDAIKKLQQGLVVSLPTETVYGLAASLSCEEAIRRIFHLKNRPLKNPLIIHVGKKEDLFPFVSFFPPFSKELMDAFWPGPLTLIFSVFPTQVPEIVRAKLPTAAFRLPSHPITKAILEKTGPLVMPSANLSGKPSSTEAKHVEVDFGSSFPVFDGGKCEKGIESTILSFIQNEWAIVRQGTLFPKAFASILGYTPKIKTSSKKPLCPGQFFRHYSPKAKLMIQKEFPKKEPIEAIIGFENRCYDHSSIPFYSLGHSSDSFQVASNLYSSFRKLDEDGISSAWIDTNFPDDALFSTLHERIQKASAS